MGIPSYWKKAYFTTGCIRRLSMIGNLFRILVFFFIIYFVFNVIKRFFAGLNHYERQRPPRDRHNGGKSRESDKVIELDRDQYKVE